MAPSAWTALLFAAPLLLGLAAAYPQRAYHDDADSAVQEKNVRHIDGLGVQQTSDAARQLEEQVRRQVEEQVRATGSGRASGSWSVTKHSEYASGGSGGSGSGGGLAPVRATITGEALEGGDVLTGISTNCHNCRLRIRKIGGGSSGGSSLSSGSLSSGGLSGGEQVGGAARGVQVESSQSRYYSSRSEGGQGQDYGGARATDLTAGGGRLVQSAQQQQYGSAGYGANYGTSSGYGASGYGASANSYGRLGEADAAALGSSSSRKDTKVTKSSWQLADLGYGTSNIEDLIRRLDEDMRAGRFQNGKTVTTVTTTTSENGGPAVTRQETFVKDGLDVAQAPQAPGLLGLGQGSTAIGHSEIEDLLRGLREDLRSGKTEAGKTVTTVVESASVNGAAPVVTKKTFVRDGFDASALDLASPGLDAAGLGTAGSQGSRSVSRTTQSVWTSGGQRPLSVDHLGGGNLLTQSHHLARNSTTSSSYGSRTEGHDVRALDHIGGGQLIRESGYGAASSGTGSYGSDIKSTGSYGSDIKSTRRVDALGGGHLLRETPGGQGAYGTTSYKETRRVDALGGGHLIRDTDTAAAAATDSLSVSQMPGYRKNGPLETDAPAYGSNSKYYSTFQTSSYTGGAGGAGGAVDSGLAGSQQAALGGAESALSGASDGATRTSSSSSYKKVVKYSSSGSSTVERDQDVGGNQAFITAEGGRIPEAGSGSYFGSSSYQRGSSGISGVNPGAPAGTVVVPVRGPAAASVSAAHASRSEWAESTDDEYPPLRGNPAPAARPDGSVQRGVSLKDIGILPSDGSTQQASAGYSSSTTYTATGEGGYGASGAGYGASGSNYGATGSNYGATGSNYGATGSNYGASGSSYRSSSSYSRQYEMPATAHSTSWSSTYSSGSPSRTSSSYGSQYGSDGARAQRMAQVHTGGPDCDRTIKI